MGFADMRASSPFGASRPLGDGEIGVEERYRDLANAVVAQAARELRAAYRMRARAEARLAAYESALGTEGELARLKVARREITRARERMAFCERKVAELEDFFASDDFAMLSDLDGWQLVLDIQEDEGL